MQTDLVVLSHLRWTWVWQRPQHLVTRLARERRTWFVEEPLPSPVPAPCLRTEEHGAVTRVWLEVPSSEPHLHFTAPAAAGYPERLIDLLGTVRDRVVWLYTPMALDIAQALGPAVLVYDVMDDLAAFAQAPPELVLRQRRALRAADLVFTGGRSLHRSVLPHRPDGVHLFPSGVEVEHYAAARRPRPAGARPVAGYVGVLDERLDLGLVAGLAATLPDWELRMIGPVADVKLDPAALPQAPNLVYTGPQPYDRLPEVMAGLDVALMPFALNEATRSISPTKTLEYLAAGLPVVSTRVPDVAADYTGIVELCDDAAGFAQACRRALGERADERDRVVGPLLQRQSWDAIAERMAELVRVAASKTNTEEESA